MLTTTMITKSILIKTTTTYMVWIDGRIRNTWSSI